MKERIISAAVILLVFVPILLVGELPFAIFMSVLSILGLYELLKARESKKEFPILLKLFAFVMVFCFSMYNYDSLEFQFNFDYRVMAFILFLFLSPLVFINNSKKYSVNDALFLISALLFIGLSFNLIIILRNFELTYIIYLLLITTLTDTFALFTGKLVGRHKLCPAISPNKTIEGLVGGVIMGVFAACAFYYTVINPDVSLLLLVGITLILSLVGQLGDLVFSFIKRYFDVKDFSNLIPGHGGILDRFDSLIFVVFAFVILRGIL